MGPIGQLLVDRGWISDQQLQIALRNQRVLGGRTGTCLLELDALPEQALTSCLAEQHGLPAVAVETLQAIPPEVVALLPARLALRYQAVPFEVLGARVDVAMLDLNDLVRQDELAFGLGRRLQVFVALEVRVLEALARFYGATCPPRITRILDRLNRHRAAHRVPPLPDMPATPGVAPWLGAEPAPPRFDAAAVSDARAAEPVPGAVVQPTPAPARTVPARPPLTLAADAATEPAEKLGAGVDIALAERRLGAAREGSEVGAILLETLSRLFDRALVLRVQRGRVEGWLGHGTGLDSERLREFNADLGQPSVFREMDRGRGLFIGRLGPSPVHLRLTRCWHGDPDPVCLLLPVRVGGRLALVLYGDREGRDLAGLDAPPLLVLAARATAALQSVVARQRHAGPPAAASR